jgi:hypothetical protein
MSFDSVEYWQKRYASGGNSGAGSYGALADFKAHSLNRFIEDHGIVSVIEFGSGDGNQLSQLKIPKYLGIDVSPKAIEDTKASFANDPTKTFYVYDPDTYVPTEAFMAQIAISMDVILHLTEDARYEKYMANLSKSSLKFIGIFNTATEEQLPKMASHNRFRDHRTWLKSKASEFREVRVDLLPEELKYPIATGFYYYERD